MICQNGELFRTNNNAEAFHSSLRRLFFTAHPQFDVFVENMNDLADSVKTEWEAERLPLNDSTRVHHDHLKT